MLPGLGRRVGRHAEDGRSRGSGDSSSKGRHRPTPDVRPIAHSQVNFTNGRLRPRCSGDSSLDDVLRPEPGGHIRTDIRTAWGRRQMMVWPALTLLGFLVLTALVIAMGTQSTARYEREREERTSSPLPAGAEAMGAVSV